MPAACPFYYYLQLLAYLFNLDPLNPWPLFYCLRLVANFVSEHSERAVHFLFQNLQLNRR
jgi:hypothetical protein